MSSDRGQAMTQEQITDYLIKRMFRYSESEDIPGSLSQNSIHHYLAFIRETLAIALEKGQFDILEVDDFVDLVDPIVTEMLAREKLTEAERVAYLEKIQQQAEQYLAERQSESIDTSVSALETEKPSLQSSPDSADTDPFLMQELIPIGFEKGAPRISITAFFQFPFGKKGKKEIEDFAQHLRYLEEVVSRGGLGANDLSKIKSMTSRLPVLTYRKYYDIYPFNQFDETILLVAFSLWQNNVLDTLLVVEEMES
jgi:hypothetical protein